MVLHCDPRRQASEVVLTLRLMIVNASAAHDALTNVTLEYCRHMKVDPLTELEIATDIAKRRGHLRSARVRARF
jgi:hypothetical protein